MKEGIYQSLSKRIIYKSASHERGFGWFRLLQRALECAVTGFSDYLTVLVDDLPSN